MVDLSVPVTVLLPDGSASYGATDPSAVPDGTVKRIILATSHSAVFEGKTLTAAGDYIDLLVLGGSVFFLVVVVGGKFQLPHAFTTP